MSRPYASQRVSGFSETVFAKYTRLAQAAGAINLGQGFPDFDPPEFVRAALREAASGYQQYAPLPGLPVLLEALTHKLARELSADHLQITVGATEGLFASMQAILDPGDEVVLVEPFYDAYPADVTMAGGVPRYVPLEPQADGRWSLDLDELRAAFTPRTKAIILNTPHNPTGKVFTAAELDAVVALAEQYDAVIVADEVYEHIAFVPHLPVASRPGAWPRTLTLSSVGKSFSATGWKIGWAVGPKPLISALRLAHQWIPFAVATPLQQAAANILQQAETSGYYAELSTLYRRKRDLLVAALAGTPLKPLTSEGSYFVMADSSALGLDDVALCDALPGRVGVAAIPPSAFYSEAHKPLAKHLLRLAFCKSDAALIQAGERLKGLAEAFA